jgi:hypothetical protein
LAANAAGSRNRLERQLWADLRHRLLGCFDGVQCAAGTSTVSIILALLFFKQLFDIAQVVVDFIECADKPYQHYARYHPGLFP